MKGLIAAVALAFLAATVAPAVAVAASGTQVAEDTGTDKGKKAPPKTTSSKTSSSKHHGKKTKKGDTTGGTTAPPK